MAGPGLRTVGLAVAALVALAGCGGGSSSTSGHSGPVSSPSARSRAAGPAGLADWQAKGAAAVPPDSVRNPSLGGVQVVNQTGGAVSDADARRWAEAFIRGSGYELWALNSMQDRFLIQSGIGSPAQQVFSWDLGNITRARQAGMKVEAHRLVLRRLVLRPVPQALQATFTASLFQWTPYAFFLDEVGPGDLFWVDAQGNKTSKWHVDGGAGSPELVGGQLLQDQVMGDVWVQASDWTCATPDGRRTFGALCNP
jgi:hypothetical protein